MKGIQHVEVSNRDVKFKFDLYRNITVVRGDSGTGKTTLYNMIAAYTRLKEKSGVNVSSPKECVALMDINWTVQLENTKGSIVFIDEGAEYLRTLEFAKAIRQTDNYYVIFCRESLRELPYSPEEIYEIKTSGKFHSFKKMYKSSSKHIYYQDKAEKSIKFDTFLTEDSKSGYQFYLAYTDSIGLSCETAYSNAAIFTWLKEHKDQKVLVIADGAAFGSEIDRVLKLRPQAEFRLCLPESFEWLILKSGLIKAEDVPAVLENPSEFIESSKYFNWENFFTKYLVEKSLNTPFQYTKQEIKPVYLNEANMRKIIEEIYKK